MTENDIMAELSYAYLHAVAARAGFGCQASGRISFSEPALDQPIEHERQADRGSDFLHDSAFEGTSFDYERDLFVAP